MLLKNVTSEHGFTLIEALLSLFVLMIGILGMMAMQTNAVRCNYRAATLTCASAVASGELENLRARSFSDSVLDPAGSPVVWNDPVTGYQITLNVQDAPPPINNDAKDITVTVARPAPLRPVVYTYRKFRDL